MRVAQSNRPETKRILLRSPKHPFEPASPVATLNRNLIASNSGNLVFLHAAYKLLAAPGVEVTPDRLKVRAADADEINERYDAYVIPLANAFRHSFEPILIKMTQLIQRLHIPVIVLGVGAQSNLKYELDRLRRIEPSVKAFVSAVLDRSGSIGVRGELSEAYLRGLGFRDVEVIGCPSMFMYGDRLHVEKRVERLQPESRVSINVSPYVKSMGDVVMSHHARYPNLTYIAQDLITLEMLLAGDANPDTGETSNVPIHRSHPFFRENKARFYVDPWPWIDDLRSCEFAFGTRIHGNIAAILAGTPAYVLAHDSRTLELARYFAIPHRLMPDVTPDMDAADLYAEADYGELNRGHAERWATFAAYLRSHRLQHVFETGEDTSDFDGRLARVTFPPPVTAAGSGADGARSRGLGQRVRNRVRRLARTKWVWRSRAAVLRRYAAWSSSFRASRGGVGADGKRR